MPIRVRVYPEKRLVLASGHGFVTDGDVFGYQREIWSRRDIQGFDEIVDMTMADDVVLPTPERMQALAELAASTDPPTTSARFAIVAPDRIMFALGRMYGAYRAYLPLSSKHVEVFRTLREALAFLDIEELT